jgi:hypothetical protein
VSGLAALVAARQPVTLTVAITQEHIRVGAPGNCATCPAALAICDAFAEIPGTCCADAMPELLTVWWPATQAGYCAETPGEVAEFMGAVDTQQHVQPFSFEATWRPL